VAEKKIVFWSLCFQKMDSRIPDFCHLHTQKVIKTFLIPTVMLDCKRNLHLKTYKLVREYHTYLARAGTDVMIFKKFPTKKWIFWHKTLLNYAKTESEQRLLRKTIIVLPKIGKKSLKLVIITLNPVWHQICTVGGRQPTICS
jgi:hypothetical protein